MSEFLEQILQNSINTAKELLEFKKRLAQKSGRIVRNTEIFQEYQKLLNAGKIKKQAQLEKLLKKRAVRTESGVAPVAVLTEPFDCPANCAYCPSEARVPKSYLANEPAVMRAIRCHYNPAVQVQSRLAALEINGHHPTKIEIIVIGGTWSALPELYQCWYIKELFRATNEFTGYEQYVFKRNKSNNSWQAQDLEKLKQELKEEQIKNESAQYRIVGLTLETRPDYITSEEMQKMRALGCTRVELGVQIVDDAVLEKNMRGHGVAATTSATKLLRNWGFKITYHVMPGLPGSTPENDLEKFKLLFNNERFQPDQIKFYPTVVIRGSLLYEWWRKGEYVSYTDKELQKLIIDCKKEVPRYVRIIRLIRDIPKESIEAGNTITNLRQIMKAQGVVCQCIRCREPRGNVIKQDVQLMVKQYLAAGGQEYFLSFESRDSKTIYGFCRLRLPDTKTQSDIPKVLNQAAIIRELHVYGELAVLDEKTNVQHRGLGKKLLAEAEKITQEKEFKKIAVISGVGVRDYYRKTGYSLEEYGYMTKNLNY